MHFQLFAKFEELSLQMSSLWSFNRKQLPQIYQKRPLQTKFSRYFISSLRNKGNEHY
jgi:hypothetical protein